MIQSRSCACYASVCQRDQTLSLTDCPCTSSSHHRLLNATIAPVHMKRYLPKCVLFFLCRLYLYLRCRDSTQKPVIQCVSRSVCVCVYKHREPSITPHQQQTRPIQAERTAHINTTTNAEKCMPPLQIPFLMLLLSTPI